MGIALRDKRNETGILPPSQADVRGASSRFRMTWNTHSIQSRFFLLIITAVLTFVVLLSVLNLLFFNQYQMMQKKHYMSKVYKEINSLIREMFLN